ncbi:hypothetical protein JYU34_002323 [Plutella xylostella]|uniref:Uncharacterized protein n=1 Tax=Plutella xylostella TaxID=51655 RepID=A0ABQ7R1Y2_PLUXY|nr:hypothetical protein JYU34_002323 [Plutella xylostella]
MWRFSRGAICAGNELHLNLDLELLELQADQTLSHQHITSHGRTGNFNYNS